MLILPIQSPLEGIRQFRQIRPSKRKGIVLMELLLLGLAGLGGLALLLQSKPLPTKEDAEKAFAKLDKDPTDADANTIFGKYKAFVQGDYDAAMPYLVHSKDTTLRTLAEHELDDSHVATAPQKVAMGDEWVAAAKNFKPLSPIFYDRAAHWYAAGWPDLDAAWKEKARIQGRKLAASRPPAASKKLPSGWVADAGLSGVQATADGTIARSGSYSGKLSPAAANVPNSYSALKSELLPVSGKTLENTAFILTDGTETGGDRMYTLFFDQAGRQIQTDQSFIPADMPFWGRVVVKSNVPKDAVRTQFAVVLNSKKGNIWVDDVSMKLDGKEVLKNGSFDAP
jgi:hypothetical protein